MKDYVLREERGRSGYLFDRKAGVAHTVRPEELADRKRRHDVDFLPLSENAPERARAAPFCVWFELTRKCNLHCPYCGAPPCGDESDPLDTDRIVAMFDDMASCGVFEIRFTGGEPTTHLHFREMVEEAAARGFFVSVNSNGVVSPELRRQLPVMPVGLYIISLDGPEPIHNELRPPDSYQEVIRTIKVLIDAGKRVRINTVLCRRNKDCLVEFVAELKRFGVEALTLVPLRPAGRAEPNFESMCLSRTQYGDVLRQVRGLRERHGLEIAASYDLMSKGKIFSTPTHFTKRCVAGVEAACLGPAGDLRACILLDDPRYIIGNLVTEPFSRLWADDKRWREFRDESRLSQRCRECRLFSIDCPGTCQVIAQHSGSPDIDPYRQCEQTLLTVKSGPQ